MTKNLRQWLLIVLVLIANGIIYFYTPADAATEPQATATPESCIAIGTAEGQTLYLCQNAYPACVWDPSPTLGSGVIDCDW